MSKGKPKPKSAKTPERVEERIVAVALENPELGAWRLAPLLRRENVDLSPSKIYGVLKSRGLQTREKRLAAINSQARKADTREKKSAASRTPPEIEGAVVALSFLNPDFGARRLLPLLKAEGIELRSSTVYGILKRNDLENRKKRLAALEGRSGKEIASEPVKAFEADSPLEEESEIVFPEEAPSEFDAFIADKRPVEEELPVASPDEFAATEAEELRTSAASPTPVPSWPPRKSYTGPPAKRSEQKAAAPVPAAEATAPLEGPAKETLTGLRQTTAGVHEIVSGRVRWLVHFVNLLLLLLLLCIGFLTADDLRRTLTETENVSVRKPSPDAGAAKPPAAENKPLPAYSRIWERNLFNVKSAEPAAEKDIPVAAIAPAKKDIGMQLVGTVVAHDPSLNRAIINFPKSRKEESYREGDSAGEVRIKKVLRNQVVITTAEGDQLLTIEPEDFASPRAAAPPVRPSNNTGLPAAEAASSMATAAGSTPVRTRAITLKREDVSASLADIEKLMAELKISPYLEEEQPAGFIVGKIPRRSILTRMGLRNGYAVTHLNGRPVTGPEEAAEFFRTLASSDEVSFQITRNRGVRPLAANIQLNIK